MSDYNYGTTDLVIYITFSMILFLFNPQLLIKLFYINTVDPIYLLTNNMQLYLYIQANSGLQCEWDG